MFSTVDYRSFKVMEGNRIKMNNISDCCTSECEYAGAKLTLLFTFARCLKYKLHRQQTVIFAYALQLFGELKICPLSFCHTATVLDKLKLMCALTFISFIAYSRCQQLKIYLNIVLNFMYDAKTQTHRIQVSQ